MEKNYDSLTGKTKSEITKIFEEAQFHDPHSDVWIFFLEKKNFGRKKFLYLFFEDNIVIRISEITKNFWE